MTSEPDDDHSKGRLVEYTLDTLPPLTDAQKADLERLTAMPDEDIDFSDISEPTDDQLAQMQRVENFLRIKK